MIAEVSVAVVMVAAGLLVTALAHLAVFGAVLLLFAGIAFGHALAVSLGLAHPPRDPDDRDRR